jgi:hypothetical protein
MTVNAAYKRLGGRQIRLVPAFGEGHFAPILEIGLVGYTKGPSLTAMIETGPCGREYSIFGIVVHDARFRTKSGLGVGSTLGDLQRLYPGSDVGNIDKDGGPSVVVSALDFTFGMETLASYTKASRVVRVWVRSVPLGEQQRRRLCADE